MTLAPLLLIMFLKIKFPRETLESSIVSANTSTWKMLSAFWDFADGTPLLVGRVSWATSVHAASSTILILC